MAALVLLKENFSETVPDLIHGSDLVIEKHAPQVAHVDNDTTLALVRQFQQKFLADMPGVPEVAMKPDDDSAIRLHLTGNWQKTLKKSHGLMPVKDKGAEKLDVRPLYSHLILVAGFAVFRGPDLRRYIDEEFWGLESWQKGKHFVDGILCHIDRALAMAASHVDRVLKRQGPASGDTDISRSFHDPTDVMSEDAILGYNISDTFGGPGLPMVVFSGGRTRPDAFDRSEGQSYVDIISSNPQRFPQARRLLDVHEPNQSLMLPRMIFSEQDARDSYENVLFGIARFYQVAGRFPDAISVIGFEYKRERIETYHRKALRWPMGKWPLESAPTSTNTEKSRIKGVSAEGNDKHQHRFRYIGAGDAAINSIAVDTNSRISDAATLEDTKADPYRCGPTGGATRMKRNPGRHGISYYSSVPPDVLKLMLHCGPELFKGPLPWDN